MLQQTTVAAVIPYYERFLARFPSVESLAEAPEQEVLRLWEGLGYYSRARNIHATAKQLVAEQGGHFPQSVAALQALRGIGRYTAGAIASFAFDVPAPIVEANTIRLYSRLIAYRDDPRSTAGQQRLWSFAGQIVPNKNAAAFNHALMDLGATICTPQDPQCELCPVRQNCNAFSMGLQRQIPREKRKTSYTDVTEAYVVIRKKDAVLVRQRQAGERWAGLWDFPRYELPAELAEQAELLINVRRGQKSLPLTDISPLQSYLNEQITLSIGIVVGIGMPFATLRHGVTRFRIRVLCFDGRHRLGEVTDPTTMIWLPVAKLAEMPLSRSGRRLAEILLKESQFNPIGSE